MLWLTIPVYPQQAEKNTDTISAILPADSATNPSIHDSTGITLPGTDTVMIRQHISSGLDYLLKQQEENRRKQKRNAMIRIGFGVAMLIVLIIGLRRRKKR